MVNFCSCVRIIIRPARLTFRCTSELVLLTADLKEESCGANRNVVDFF